MRIQLLAALVILAPAFAACGGEEPPPPQAPPPPPVASTPPPPASTAETPPPAPPKPTMADLMPVTLKSIGDAFNAHDSQKFAANFTTDAVHTDVGFGDSHGRDEIAKGLQAFFDASSDAKGAAAHTWAKGNTAAVDWVVAGTMTGDFMGMKASKKPIGHHSLIISTLNDDGLVTQAHVYGDGPGMMAQMKGAKDAPEVPTLPTANDMHWAKNTPDEDKLVDWAKGFSDTFNKDDAKLLSPSFAADADVTFFFLGGKVIKAGKDLDKFHADFFKAIPKAQFAVSSVWAADGFVVGERTLTGTMKGRLGPMPASNKDVTLHVADVFQTTADGKVAHAWAFGNMVEMMPPKDAKGSGKDKAAAPGPATAPAQAAATAGTPKK
jgi:predicted ester cyclase